MLGPARGRLSPIEVSSGGGGRGLLITFAYRFTPICHVQTHCLIMVLGGYLSTAPRVRACICNVYPLSSAAQGGLLKTTTRMLLWRTECKHAMTQALRKDFVIYHVCNRSCCTDALHNGYSTSVVAMNLDTVAASTCDSHDADLAAPL